MRPAESQRHSETLCIADGNIRAKFARRLQQCERKNICCDDNQCAGIVRLADEIRIILNRAIGSRILDKRAEHCVVKFEPRVIADLDFDPERLRAGLDHGNRLRVTVIGDEERFFAAGSRPGYSVTKRHCFSGGCRFIQH